MSFYLRKFFLFIYFLTTISSKRDSFKNECGPYNGIEDTVLMPKLSDCTKDTTTPRGENQKCCIVEGEKDLISRSSCILIEDIQTARIQVIEDLSEIATKLKVDCGTSKEFKSDCGQDSPSSEDDCKSDDGEGKCCFIKIESSQFTGNACRKFKDININTIGEAVVAAKTVGATLEVKCNYTKGIKGIGYILSLAVLFLF